MINERKKAAQFVSEVIDASFVAGRMDGPRCACGSPAVVLGAQAGDGWKTGPLCFVHVSCVREALALFGFQMVSVQCIEPVEYVKIDARFVDGGAARANNEQERP